MAYTLFKKKGKKRRTGLEKKRDRKKVDRKVSKFLADLD